MKPTHCSTYVFLASLAAMVFFVTVPAPPAQDSQPLFEDGEPLPDGVEPYNDEAFYYTVQKGDTLWDISERFLKSPWKWPELWQRNANEVPIRNPHLIYPGQRLLIYPLRGVIATEPLPSPRPVEAPKPVPVEPAPPSGGFEETPIDDGRKKMIYSPINRVGFIRQMPVEPHGVIFKVQGDDKQMIHERDIVYIRPTGEIPLVLGREYTIYKTAGPIQHPETNQYVGYQHIFTGRLEITRLEPEYAMGVIRTSHRTIRKNEMLMPHAELSPKIPFVESVKGLEGIIVSSEEGGRLLGDGAVVFIDKGKDQGVAPGQRYSIVYQETVKPDPMQNKLVTLLPVVVGEIVVLRAEPTTATVVLTKSKRDIYPGAHILSPIQ